MGFELEKRNLKCKVIFTKQVAEHKPTGRLNASGQSQSKETILGNGISACSKSGSGEFCSALIIKDGWEIGKDYPW